jgi:hypothetical protein
MARCAPFVHVRLPACWQQTRQLPSKSLGHSCDLSRMVQSKCARCAKKLKPSKVGKLMFSLPLLGLHAAPQQVPSPLPLSLMSAVHSIRHVFGLNDVLRMRRATWVHITSVGLWVHSTETHAAVASLSFLSSVGPAVAKSTRRANEPSCLRAPRARARAFAHAVATRAHRLSAPVAFAHAVTLLRRV